MRKGLALLVLAWFWGCSSSSGSGNGSSLSDGESDGQAPASSSSGGADGAGGDATDGGSSSGGDATLPSSEAGAGSFVGSWSCVTADDGGPPGTGTIDVTAGPGGALLLSGGPDAGACTVDLEPSASAASLAPTNQSCDSDAGVLALPGIVMLKPTAPDYTITSETVTAATLTLGPGSLLFHLAAIEQQVPVGGGSSHSVPVAFDDLCTPN